MPADSTESQPLLPLHTTPTSSKLGARRYIPSPTFPSPFESNSQSTGNGRLEREEDEGRERTVKLDKGKGRALPPDEKNQDEAEKEDGVDGRDQTRDITIMFSNRPYTNLLLTLTPTNSVLQLKSLIKAHHPDLAGRNIKLIHAGRLLADGVRVIAWVEAFEKRIKRRTEGAVESVVREVRGLGEEKNGHAKEKEMVWIHCIIGNEEEANSSAPSDAPAAPVRRGFDTLLDAGLSPEDVAQMRRQFYESRGEEVPEGVEAGHINDEHARALEEQWIEGDLTAETAITSNEGLYTSILHGLLVGFLFPLMAWLFFRELPLPNFFDADAEAREHFARMAEKRTTRTTGAAGANEREQENEAQVGNGSGSTHATEIQRQVQIQVQLLENLSNQVNSRMATNFAMSGLTVPTQVFGKRMQMGIFLGTIINFAFGALRMLN
ncbi:hypothetical protein L204_105786 [Cryptococcus depauperatus]